MNFGRRPCEVCAGVGHLGPATGAAQQDYGRACQHCDGTGEEPDTE